MESVCGVRCAGFPLPQTHLEPVLVYDSAEPVPAYWTVVPKLRLVHVPKFHTSDTGVYCPHFPYVLERKRHPGCLGQCRVFVVLIISLLGYAKQYTKELDVVASRIPCMQVPYCLAPAFFLIGILNLASATFISSS